MKAFETWTQSGRRFLAIPQEYPARVFVVDEFGNNFGAWYSVASFRKALREKGFCGIDSLGTVVLSFHCG